jgi:hypothetical protein
MHIICPKCSTGNAIDFAQHITCGDCKQSFEGFTFKRFKKPFIGTSGVIALTAFVTFHTDQHFFEANRYSAGVVYEIVHNCANPQRTVLADYEQRQMAKLCICALDKTMADISEKELAGSGSKFKHVFDNYAEQCRQRG